MNERIKRQGQKVQKKKKLKELEIKADNLITNIRDRIDPFEEWLELKTEQAKASMDELDQLVKKGKQINEEIIELEKALGER